MFLKEHYLGIDRVDLQLINFLEHSSGINRVELHLKISEMFKRLWHSLLSFFCEEPKIHTYTEVKKIVIYCFNVISKVL